MDLDPTDVAILRCLQSDSRMSYRDIARAIGVSTPTVSARVTRLERTGILKGYTALVDPEDLNETSVTLVIRSKPSQTRAVAERLGALPWVRRVSITQSGPILAEATILDPRGLDALMDAIGRIRSVIEVDPFVTVRTVKGAPRAVIADRLTATITCFECKGPIVAEPVRRRLDGRDHFFCCSSCESLYVKRYEAVKARAEKGPRRR